jgi:hypothetical protein
MLHHASRYAIQEAVRVDNLGHQSYNATKPWMVKIMFQLVGK